MLPIVQASKGRVFKQVEVYAGCGGGGLQLCQHSSAFPVTRHCSPLFCPTAPHLSPAQNNLQKPGRKHKSDRRAQIDHAALCYPPCQQPSPGTYHFTPLTISSSARPFFAQAGVSWNNGGGSQVGRLPINTPHSAVKSFATF